MRSLPSPTWRVSASSPVSSSAFFSRYISVARRCITSTTLLSLCRRFHGTHWSSARRNAGVPITDRYGVVHRYTERSYNAGL